MSTTEKALDAISGLERQRLMHRTATTAPLLGTDDPAGEFQAADLEGQRRIIDALARVTLHGAPRGRKVFNPASVTIEWK